jgi:hypothetical protein
MTSFVVELSLPVWGQEGLAAATERARLAAEQSTRDGIPTRYVRSIFIPEDETCFHVFQGASARPVSEASRRATPG